MTAPDAFVTAKSGSDDFVTVADYQALAERILGSVRDSRPLIVVTGDPPPSPHALSASLDQALAQQRPVIVLSCGSLLRGDALLDLCRGLAAHTQENDNQPPSPAFPLFIFDEASRLSDEQIKSIYGTVQSRDHWTVVMLGRPDFLVRLERSEIRFARHQLATALHFQESDGPGTAASPPPARGPGGKAFVTAEAPLAGPDLPTAPSPRDEIPPSADQNARFDWLERRLSGKPAARPVSPPSPSLFEQLIGSQPRRSSRASRLAAPEMQGRQPDAAARAGIPFAAPASADEEVQAAPLRPAAPASLQPVRRRGARVPWPAIVAVCCLAGVVSAATVLLHLRGERAASVKPAVEGAAAPNRQAMSPAATEPPPAPSPMAEPETAAAPAPIAAPPPGASAPGEPAPPKPVSIAPAAPPTPTAPAAPPVAALRPDPVPAPAPPPAQLRAAATETPEATALVARGDAFLATGDVASARLFYERAADAGDAQAALRLGESFDPGFLEQAHVRGAKGDPGAAISWYRRARELGSAEAGVLLKSLDRN